MKLTIFIFGFDSFALIDIFCSMPLMMFFFFFLLRISITFRKMDESKRPQGYAPEPDLQGLQPLSYEAEKATKLNSERPVRRHSNRRGGNIDARGSAVRSDPRLEPRYFNRGQWGPGNWRRSG